MKKMKKLAALVLALVMAFSLMAVTAAAAGVEEHEHDAICCEATIQPRIPAMQCPKCQSSMNVRVYYDTEKNRFVEFTCPVVSCRTVVSGIPW